LVLIIGQDDSGMTDFIFSLVSDDRKTIKLKKPLKGFKKISIISSEVVILKDDNFSVTELESFFSIFDEVIVVFKKSKKMKNERKIISLLTEKDTLLASDDLMEKLSKKKLKKRVSFGFKREADFYMSDLNLGDKINFKINYNGSSIPVWYRGEGKKEDALKITGALAVGSLLNLNLVDLTRRIKN